jgi:uncharacterized membrane protein YdjX (TVP38/TMEM64 family)
MRAVRLAGLAGIVAASFVAVALLLPHSPSALRNLAVAAGPVAPLLAVAAWTLLTPALFPGTVLAAGTGLAFGAVGGAGLALVGAVLGGLAAFLMARTLARGPLEDLIARSSRLRRLNSLLESRGFAAVLAARLMPGVPVTGLHYAAGVSRVKLLGFVAALAIGALLRTTPYALLGQGLGSGSVPAILVAVGSIVIGGTAAAALFRRLHLTAA